MPKSVEAIYEDGVLKPLSPLKLKEHEKVRVIFKKETSVVKATKGMFSGLDDSTIDEIALSPELLLEEG